MADMVVSAFFTFFFEKLTSEAMKRIARARGIQSEFNKLEDLLHQVNDLLYDASRKESKDKRVKRWVNKLQHLAYDIDDVLDELATESIERELTERSGSTMSNKVRKLIPTCCTNFSLSSRMHGKLDKIATKLQELVDEKNGLGLVVIRDEMPKAKTGRYETSLIENPIIGRQGQKEALVRKLLGGKDGPSNRNFSIVPIVGLGGLGKTSLAKLLYSEKDVEKYFQVKAWVCVSDVLDFLSISNVIYQSVTGETSKNFTDLNLVQIALREKLRNKLFLIVLDDVWSESDDDWDKLVSPFHEGAPGSRIIMTTRKKELLRKLGYGDVDPLPGLSHDYAMRLFSQRALGVENFDSHQVLRPYAEGLVKKCSGLPLTLRSLGGFLNGKDEEEWKEILDSDIWTLGEKEKTMEVLRRSYDDLNAPLKRCLHTAHCSPKTMFLTRSS